MTSEQKPGNKDKLAGKIAGAILGLQSNISKRLNRFRYLKTMLICFCVTSAVISGYVLVDAIVSKPKQKIRIDRIKTPNPSYEPTEELYDERIPEEVYQSIQAYKKYADSVGERIRPGLLDSMRVLEEMYLEQQKNK